MITCFIRYELDPFKKALAEDPLGRENYEFARRERFILREDRTFLKIASLPHAAVSRPDQPR
jgi:hypothetical protein